VFKSVIEELGKNQQARFDAMRGGRGGGGVGSIILLCGTSTIDEAKAI
jgi:hypothetical protein